LKYRQQLGITLMELLITIAIIAILAAVGVPLYTGNIRAAKNADAQNTLKSIYLMEKITFLKTTVITLPLGRVIKPVALINTSWVQLRPQPARLLLALIMIFIFTSPPAPLDLEVAVQALIPMIM